jgi:hypothetical protein
MKIISALAAILVAAILPAHAASTYHVTGALQGVNTKGATVDPDLYIHSGATAYSTAASAWPAFTGEWQIEHTDHGAAISGVFGAFAQYSTAVNAGFLGGKAVTDQPHLVYSFAGGSVSYDAATRTLTLGQPLVFSERDSALDNAAASDATLHFDASAGAKPAVCSGSKTICSGQAEWFMNKPDLEKFYLQLTFSPDFRSFTGSAVGVDVGGSLALGKTGDTWYSYRFSGALAAAPSVGQH